MVIAAHAGQLHEIKRRTEPFSALGIYGTLLFFLLYLQAANSINQWPGHISAAIKMTLG